MITISRPWVDIENQSAFAKVRVTIDKETCEKWAAYCDLPENRDFTQYLDAQYADTVSGETILWFSVEEKFREGLCVDRADAFVTVLLHYALATGSDIRSEAPVSSTLLYNIRTELVPHLCTGKFRPIEIYAEEIDAPYPTQNCGATGMSCGIDSLFTVWMHDRENIPKSFRVKYLTFFNVGAINGIFADGVPLARRNELMLEISKQKAKQAQDVADECGMELVFVNSNISDYYRGMLVNSAHYRNCGTAMLLSGLWNKYYYSSAGFDIDDVKYDLSDDPAYHEESLAFWLSNGIICFYPAGHGYLRMEKTTILADDPLAQKYLTVCDRAENCGKCGKCKRTISTLLALGKLSNFSGRFDVGDISKNINSHKQRMFLNRKQHFYDHIFETAMQHHFFTTADKILYSLETIPWMILRKTKLYRTLRLKHLRRQTNTVKQMYGQSA